MTMARQQLRDKTGLDYTDKPVVSFDQPDYRVGALDPKIVSIFKQDAEYPTHVFFSGAAKPALIQYRHYE